MIWKIHCGIVTGCWRENSLVTVSDVSVGNGILKKRIYCMCVLEYCIVMDDHICLDQYIGTFILTNVGIQST